MCSLGTQSAIDARRQAQQLKLPPFLGQGVHKSQKLDEKIPIPPPWPFLSLWCCTVSLPERETRKKQSFPQATTVCESAMQQTKERESLSRARFAFFFGDPSASSSWLFVSFLRWSFASVQALSKQVEFFS